MDRCLGRAKGDMRVSLGVHAIVVPEQRPDDLLADAHDGVAVAECDEYYGS
jgi:hypothetical protein